MRGVQGEEVRSQNPESRRRRVSSAAGLNSVLWKYPLFRPENKERRRSLITDILITLETARLSIAQRSPHPRPHGSSLHSHAAPLTPLESPWVAFRIGVSKTVEKV